jgi:hypothetical protein
MESVKTFNELRKINVNDKIERKGNLSYLSWTHAVDLLLQNDPTATWSFHEPKLYGQTMMVSCSVTALGKTMNMHLPVMDNRNNAIANPDARKVSDAMMRCLAKCIACFGIGLYIFHGEDLPQDSIEDTKAQAVELKDYRCEFGTKYKGKTLAEIGIAELDSYVKYLMKSSKDRNQPFTKPVAEFVDNAIAFINQYEQEAAPSEFEKFRG